MREKRIHCPSCGKEQSPLWLPDEIYIGGNGILLADPVVICGTTYYVCRIRDGDVLCMQDGHCGKMDAVFLMKGNRVSLRGDPKQVILIKRLQCSGCGTAWTEYIPITVLHVNRSRLLLDHEKRIQK